MLAKISTAFASWRSKSRRSKINSNAVVQHMHRTQHLLFRINRPIFFRSSRFLVHFTHGRPASSVYSELLCHSFRTQQVSTSHSRPRAFDFQPILLTRPTSEIVTIPCLRLVVERPAMSREYYSGK